RFQIALDKRCFGDFRTLEHVFGATCVTREFPAVLRSRRAREGAPATACEPDRLSGIARHDAKVWNVAGYDRAHADHRKAPDSQARTDRRLSSDRRAFAHERLQRFFVGIRRQQAIELWSGRSRRAVVGKDDARGDHDAPLDRYGGANVHESVDLDEIADLY